jgi:hypothetical protein
MSTTNPHMSVHINLAPIPRHPLDDLPNFMNSSHDSLLSDQNSLVALKGLCSNRRLMQLRILSRLHEHPGGQNEDRRCHVGVLTGGLRNRA